MSKLAKDITIYSLGGILNKAVMFLLIPLYTRVLVPADYGKLELINTVGAILVLLYGLMVENGYARMYFQYKDDSSRKALFFSGQSFNIFCSIIFGGISFLFAESISSAIFKFPGGAEYIRLITVITLVKVLTHIPFHNIRNRRKPILFVSLNLGYLVLSIILTVLFLVVFKLGVKGVLYAQIVAGIIELTALYTATRNEIGFTFSYRKLQAMLGFSLFLIPGNLSGFVLNFSNRYFLNEYTNLDEVGLYSLGAKLSGVIPILITEPVKKAFGPHLYSIIDEPEKCKQQIADFSRLFFAGLAFVALAISLFSSEIVRIVAADSYLGSHSIVFVLSISYLFLGLAGVIIIGVHITLKTWIITAIWLFSAAINIVLNILLIPKYGRMGAACATMLSVLFINISYFLAVSIVYPVKFVYIKYIEVVLLMIAANYVGSIIQTTLFYAIMLKFLLLIAFIAVLIVSNYFSTGEINKAKQVVCTIINKIKNKSFSKVN